MVQQTLSTTPNTTQQTPNQGATSRVNTLSANTASQVSNTLQGPTNSGKSVLARMKSDPLYLAGRPIEPEDPKIKAEREAKKKAKEEKAAAEKAAKAAAKEAAAKAKEAAKAAKEGAKEAAKETSKAANEEKNKNEKAEGKESKESGEKNEAKKSDSPNDKKKKPGIFSKMFKNPNISYNPLSRGWQWGKSLVQGAIAVPGRVVAKAAHIVGRPQQLFEGEARSDMVKNSGRGFANLFRGITGGIYKPHRTALAYENAFKDYGAGRGPKSTKNPAKLFCWAFGKFLCPVPFVPIPKIASHIVQTAGHFLADTASGKFDYTHTSSAIKKAVEWDHVVGPTPGAKVVSITEKDDKDKKVTKVVTEEKKAA